MSYRLEIQKGGVPLFSYGASHPFAKVFSYRVSHDQLSEITREMILDMIGENQADWEAYINRADHLEKVLSGLTGFEERCECVGAMGEIEDQIADCQKVHFMLGMLLDIVEEPCEGATVEGGFF